MKPDLKPPFRAAQVAPLGGWVVLDTNHQMILNGNSGDNTFTEIEARNMADQMNVNHPAPMEDHSNQIVAIGYLGTKTCYIGVSEEEARERYKADKPDDEDFSVEVIPINNGTFVAYDIWEAS